MAKSDIKEIVKILFVQVGLNQKEIYLKLKDTQNKVSEATISKWAQEGRWKELKTNLVNSKNDRLSELYKELEEFNLMIKSREVGFRFPTSKEADVRRKLIRDIADLETKYNIAQTTVIARDFVTFCRDIDMDFSLKANEYFDLFINSQIDKQKWQNA